MPLELDSIFHPRSIAVVGASTNPENRGYGYVEALLYHKFPGPVYPVNPQGADVLGVKAYTSLLEVPGKVDYVISNIPARLVLQLVDEAAQKEVRTIQFFTARFSETGHEEDARLEREMLRRAKEAGIRVIGPNCMGLYYPAGGMSFRRFELEAGHVGVLSQSGGNAVETIYLSTIRGVRFSKVLSYGNGFDVNEADLMEYFAEDPETHVIGGYLEGVRDGRRFARALRHAAARKPVVLFKGGATAAGTKAVSSHTASLAGSRQVWQAAMSQANAVVADSMDDLIDMLVAFQFCKPTTGFRVGMISGGGGRMVESADTCEQSGLVVEPIPQGVRDEFKRRSPRFWDWVSNPADGSILSATELDEKTILQLMAASGSYDMLIANVREMWHADSDHALKRIQRLMKEYCDLAHEISIPISLIQNDTVADDPLRNSIIQALRAQAIQAGVAMYPGIRRAARAMHRLAAYYRNRALPAMR